MSTTVFGSIAAWRFSLCLTAPERGMPVSRPCPPVNRESPCFGSLRKLRPFDPTESASQRWFFTRNLQKFPLPYPAGVVQFAVPPVVSGEQRGIDMWAKRRTLRGLGVAAACEMDDRWMLILPLWPILLFFGFGCGIWHDLPQLNCFRESFHATG